MVKCGAGFMPPHACTVLLAAASLPALSMHLTACPASWAKWLGSTDGCFPADFLSQLKSSLILFVIVVLGKYVGIRGTRKSFLTK